MIYRPLSELIAEALKNRKKYIGRLVLTTDNLAGICVDVTEDGFVLDPNTIVDLAPKIDNSGV